MANVLCVDEEPHVANLQCLISEGAGHSATPAWTVSDALASLEQQRYDVIVTGWRFCDGSGYAIVKVAKSLWRSPKVIVGGYVRDEDQTVGPVADLYFEKPIDPAELADIIDELLRG
jgi:DNA-binding response OmpR family regulator